MSTLFPNKGLLTDVKLNTTSDIDIPDQYTLGEGSPKNVALKKAAEDAILFLKNRQEFWSQFKPSYCQQKI